MALPLSNLDDRTYADLVEEAQALIPTYDPSWTNHNPSDPGMTLIELFAWLTEMLIYRANRMPDQHLITFLKLLNGPEWQPGPDLAEDIRSSVLHLRQPYRAVTCEDYESLAREAAPEVARAACVPQRYLDAGTERERTAHQPGHLSVIIVPHSEDLAPQPSPQLRQTVWDDLAPRRVLTTRHHIVGPVYAPASVEMLIARRDDVGAEDLQAQVVGAIEKFLHPLKGGPEGHGWPFGRDIYVSQLYELLERLPGVNYVPDISLSSQCPPGASRCAAATELWHDNGDPIGLSLAAHHLPQAQINPDHIVISAVFVSVQVTAQVTAATSAVPADVRRAVKTAIKRRFHPLHGGPEGQSAEEIGVASLRQLIQLLPQVADVEVSLQSDPAHSLRNDLGQTTGVRIEIRELADVQVMVTLG